MRLTIGGLIIACSALCASATAQAQNYPHMLDRMNEIRQHPGQTADAIAAGQERAQLCGYCHGRDGNSVRNHIPNLASQNPEYLLKQFHLFATGERESYVMEQVGRMLTADEMVNLSLFFASQPVTAQTAVSASKLGREKYQNFCFACHGEQGEGNRDMPRLAGQKKEFLIKALTDFKQGKSARANSPMVKIMRAVDSGDIEPLADYIAAMP
ncbi:MULTISPECIES: c-type cytochrome [Marinobacter]|uniref:C-type cytochrome n=1 Tax=Marinobacter suaedae TaxID=3057675 RepID=A0ABT8VZ73_9GAMM|nr:MULTISPECIES: c-type cytochrome [unclassified Marinobacter]MBZ2169426.1 cytochrome c4 [Marinobacter sp. F4216]MDO3721291.1 c-type cytochrome [Marinobacter sp. chi1]